MIRRIYWRILRALGFEQAAWDQQFNAGVWDRKQVSEETISHVCRLSNGGRIIEFGCGDGSLPASLPDGTFSRYSGFDISPRAVGIAKAKNGADCCFEALPMEDWPGGRNIDLIVLEECLYYLGRSEMRSFLRRCRHSLSTTGRILAIIHDPAKHAATIETCREVCEVEHETRNGQRTYLEIR